MQSMVNLDGVKAISRGQRKWLFALGRASVCVLAVLTAVFTLHLLYSAYCALSWGGAITSGTTASIPMRYGMLDMAMGLKCWLTATT